MCIGHRGAPGIGWRYFQRKQMPGGRSFIVSISQEAPWQHDIHPQSIGRAGGGARAKANQASFSKGWSFREHPAKLGPDIHVAGGQLMEAFH